MKTSAYSLSNSQQWIFVAGIIFAILFTGCNDSPTGLSSDRELPNTRTIGLEGNWTELPGKGKKSQASLDLTASTGRYRVSSDDGSADAESMLFTYEHINSNVINITVIQHQLNGKIQPAGAQENVFYSLNGNILRIFNRSFIRKGVKVDEFLLGAK